MADILVKGCAGLTIAPSCSCGTKTEALNAEDSMVRIAKRGANRSNLLNRDQATACDLQRQREVALL